MAAQDPHMIVECPDCSGEGKTGCMLCHGKGDTIRHSPMGVGGLDISPCLACGATGQVTCELCDGSGRIEAKDKPGCGTGVLLFLLFLVVS